MDAIKAAREPQRLCFQHPLLRLFPLSSSASGQLQALQSLVQTACDGDADGDQRAGALQKLVHIEHFDSDAWSFSALVDEVIETALTDRPGPLLREQLVLRHAYSAGLRAEYQPQCGATRAVPNGAHFWSTTTSGPPHDEAASDRQRLARTLREAVHDLLLLGEPGVRALSSSEAAASVRLLQLYVSGADDGDEAHSAREAQDYLDAGGALLWDRLIDHLGDEATGIYGAGIKDVSLSLLKTKCEGTATPSTTPTEVSVRQGWHTIVHDVIPEGSESATQATLVRYETLRAPMAVAKLPSPMGVRSTLDQLRKEFPWAASAVDALAEDLLPRAAFGGIEFGLTPTLLYGPPGCGKSRLARRVAELTGVPFMALPMAGASDARFLLGTARGWADGQPSPIIDLLHRRACASALVLIDEVDKTASYTATSVAPTVALLSLLEPENAARWFDTYLQAHCDLSKVAFWATANDIRRLGAPLLSRLRPIYVPAPAPEHFAAALDLVIADTLRAWGLPERLSEGFDVRSVLRTRVRNLRDLQAAVRRELSAWISTVAEGTARH